VQITIRQRGGLAGIDLQVVRIDTDTLAAGARQHVEQMIRSSGVLADQLDRPIGADLLEYEVTMEDQGRRQAWIWVDDGGPGAAPVRDLVARLTDLG